MRRMDYDEDLSANPFLCALQEEFVDLYSDATTHKHTVSHQSTLVYRNYKEVVDLSTIQCLRYINCCWPVCQTDVSL